MTKKKPNKAADRPLTAGLSVRFTEEERDLIDKAAEIETQPVASFIRAAAVQASVEIINAHAGRKQIRAIESLATEVARRLLESKVQVRGEFIDEQGEVDAELRVMPRYVEHKNPACDFVVESLTLDAEETKSLRSVLTHAARPFAKVLLQAITDSLSGEDQAGFTPIIDTDVAN
ncbi:DUF1778 domain-containing protein [bacterium]|nr:DUF1778 domain-containing protein [bacterium]